MDIEQETIGMKLIEEAQTLRIEVKHLRQRLLRSTLALNKARRENVRLLAQLSESSPFIERPLHNDSDDTLEVAG